MKGLIQSVEVAYLVHATEDPDRLEAAVSKLIGRPATTTTETLEGHFGNRIIRAMVRLVGDEASDAARSLAANIPDDVKRELASDVLSFIDEHSTFFLRLDKQSLVAGRPALGHADAVRVKIKPRAYLMKGGAPSFFLELMRGR